MDEIERLQKEIAELKIQKYKWKLAAGGYGAGCPACDDLMDEKNRELERGIKRIARLESLLQECAEFLDNYIDVVDGPDGKPRPNPAMALFQLIEEEKVLT